jgi:hypothetical protein
VLIEISATQLSEKYQEFTLVTELFRNKSNTLSSSSATGICSGVFSSSLFMNGSSVGISSSSSSSKNNTDVNDDKVFGLILENTMVMTHNLR